MHKFSLDEDCGLLRARLCVLLHVGVHVAGGRVDALAPLRRLRRGGAPLAGRVGRWRHEVGVRLGAGLRRRGHEGVHPLLQHAATARKDPLGLWIKSGLCMNNLELAAVAFHEDV